MPRRVRRCWSADLRNGSDWSHGASEKLAYASMEVKLCTSMPILSMAGVQSRFAGFDAQLSCQTSLRELFSYARWR